MNKKLGIFPVNLKVWRLYFTKCLVILLIISALLFTGCVEKENQLKTTPPPAASSISTIPSPTATSISTPTATDQIVTYPSREEVIKYVANIKKVPPNEVELIEFKNIQGAYMIFPQTYHEGGYVAVSLLVSNYTAIVMAYKDDSNVFTKGNYTASTIEEKKLFDLLINVTFRKNGTGPFFGRLIPVNINITNSSCILNKSEIYSVNYTCASIESSYATFEFISRFNGFHGYWPNSNGWVDVKTKQIWIENQPNV